MAQVHEATCWNKDTARGFFTGLKKKEITVEAAGQVRPVGPKAPDRGTFGVTSSHQAGRDAAAYRPPTVTWPSAYGARRFGRRR
ncbi:hypothetical protein [Falsiroseomonas sp.]|uniref:hypothetical protein n=1 Tax=Falsiroseomonas sp. TaxID=2870721 RepID=UPI003569436F